MFPIKNFIAMLKADFYRAFFSAGFVVGVAATVAIFLFGSVGMVSHEVSAVAAFNNTYKYNNISDMLFLAATFAYSAGFCVDWQTRFAYPLIIRSETTAYTLSKCVTAAVVGGLAVAIGAAIFIAGVCVTQSSMLPRAIEIEVEFSPQAFGDLLLAGQPGLFFLSYLFIIFLQAAFFSSLGLLVSSYLPNKYAAHIAPFTLGFMMNQIANVFHLPIWLDPVKLSMAKILNTPAPTILLMATATFLSLIMLCAILFIRKVKRRIANG